MEAEIEQKRSDLRRISKIIRELEKMREMIDLEIEHYSDKRLDLETDIDRYEEEEQEREDAESKEKYSKLIDSLLNDMYREK